LFTVARGEVAKLVTDASSAADVGKRLIAWRGDTAIYSQLGDLLFIPALMADMAGQMMVRDRDPLIAMASKPSRKLAFLDLPWVEAIEEFKRKGLASPDEYSSMVAFRAEESERTRARMLENVQAFVQDALLKSLETGGTLKGFAADIEAGKETLGIVDKDPWYIERVFRTKILGAYGDGRFKAITDPDVMEERPFTQYRTVGDVRVGDDHRPLDGLVFRTADAIWHPVRPVKRPNCRCSMVSLTAEEASAYAITTELPV